jgi:N-acyl-D-amino-acid deacylase
MTKRAFVSVLPLAMLLAVGCTKAPKYDVVIRHGTIYDGTGAPAKSGDLAILDDRIAAIGDLSSVDDEDVAFVGLRNLAEVEGIG